MTNVGATTAAPLIQASEETVPIAVAQEDGDGDGPQRQEASSNTSNTAPKCKRVSKKEQYSAKLNECILQMPEKEEDQIDLELAAIGARIKCKLSPDEINDLLDEIKDLTRAFINRKRRREEIAAVSVQPTTSTAPTAVTVAPPPPLQRQPIIQTQSQAKELGDQSILFNMTGIPPMEQYDMQYVSDPGSQTIYIKLN